ncbi:Eco57I restriction-modification methylase domain-containing protein [Gillisia sp. Hel_I_29]|uniref:Eco57I restriction-modification methylase domain-containing protein n=1 Tax=Gillisia sp. Hel_I_29 TaxID=1249975 RepID=UPI00054DBAC3|nr:N-6 DNA methylase [Gillisia sp. Hel_I_29]
MALFQVSVLKKYLKLQDDHIIDKAYKKFTNYFQHPEIQENIRSSKEEQFQATFLNELFVKILGYTMNPNPSYNLTTEYKNEKNARKADGAILNDGTAIGVIELKGTNTKHLEGIRQQAFDYKANQKGCVYVITSNFEKLRFYINDATEFLEFDLFELNRYDFSLLWLCLQKENISRELPLKIKEDSLVVEEAITKEFYKDYSIFKRELYRDLVRKNAKHLKTFRSSEIASESLEHPELQNDVNRLEKNVKLNLFKKSQKLIDRFLFIFFAEDRGLLPPNSIHKILADWNKLKELDAQVPLYDRFKQYFNYLDTGRKISDTAAEIFAYNGGLFKPDAILDALEIDDELLHKHTAQLAKYDFESQVDVNILGHIFENSLNEIESVNAEIEGDDFDKQKSKRKKDGVFYTPKYITKYIVENTVSKLCEEKKIELGFKEEEYYRGRKRRQKDTLEALVKILDDYRAWLLKLTICDPACGSGAFLNQALDFLIKEHRYIDELKAKLLGGGLVFSDIENTILENNIYGVDINEESVEIAKLSLWLRTAQPRRKLNDLSSTIKCGNSLIDDKKVAGDKAFNWKEEFPEVFKNGGFDVVIGNPPYVRVQTIKDSINKESFELEKKYETATRRYDLFVLFIEKSFYLIKNNGKVSFILPHKFLIADFGFGIRDFLKRKKFVEEIISFGAELIFKDASTYTCILKLSKENENFKYLEIDSSQLLEPINFGIINLDSLSSEKWNLHDKLSSGVLQKLQKNKLKLENILDNISQGIKNTTDKIFMMRGSFHGNEFIGFSDQLNKEVHLEAAIMKPLAKGKDIKRYQKLDINYYQIYTHYQKENKTVPLPENILKENFPKTYNYLIEFKDFLIEKKIRYKTNPDYWYSLHRSRELDIFNSPKIVSATIQNYPNFTIDTTKALTDAGGYCIKIDERTELNLIHLLGILNSKVLWFFIKNTSSVYRGGYFAFNTTYLNPFPLPKIDQIRNSDIDKYSIKNIELYRNFNYLIIKFNSFISSKFALQQNISKKLQNWHELKFGEFIKELNKAIKVSNKVREKAAKDSGCIAELVEALTKRDEFEWMELFEENKKKAVVLQQQIADTDREIDQMVYELYGLTDEEIKIVENS